MSTRNLSMPTMQNIRQSDRFCKLITSVGVHRCLIVFSILSESTETFL